MALRTTSTVIGLMVIVRSLLGPGTALALPPPRNPRLHGFRIMMRKSGRPDLRWGRVGVGGGSVGHRSATSRDPHPRPLPTRGRGARRIFGLGCAYHDP